MTTTTVNTSAALLVALSAAHAGDTILLSGGFYSGLSLQNFNAGGTVTISSADPSNPAQITDMQIISSSGLSFDHIVLNSDPSISGVSATAASDPYPIRVQNSANIHFSDMSVHGSLDNNDTNDRAGLLISSSTNVSFDNSEFQQLSFGIVNSDSSNLSFTGNDFHDIRFAGIHGSSSYVTISGNYFHDFHPVSGDHPDAIHFFNETTTDAPHDVSVFDNIVMVGGGSPTQGIYFELPTASSAPLNNISVEDNLLVGTMYNGIALEDSNALPNTNIQISSNTIASIGDMTARIWLGNTAGATEINNNASTFIFGYGDNVTFDPTNTNAGLTYANNSVIAPVTDGGQALLQQYLAGHPGFTLPGPSPLGSSAPASTTSPSAPSAPPSPTGGVDASTGSGSQSTDVTAHNYEWSAWAVTLAQAYSAAAWPTYDSTYQMWAGDWAPLETLSSTSGTSSVVSSYTASDAVAQANLELAVTLLGIHTASWPDLTLA